LSSGGAFLVLFPTAIADAVIGETLGELAKGYFKTLVFPNPKDGGSSQVFARKDNSCQYCVSLSEFIRCLAMAVLEWKTIQKNR
jgi:hypothetical protein